MRLGEAFKELATALDEMYGEAAEAPNVDIRVEWLRHQKVGQHPTWEATVKGQINYSERIET